VNHISRSWRLSSPPSRGTIQEPRASNLLYNVNRRLSNLSMHSKRPHALKPRPGGNNFVTVRCAVIEDEKWNNQKDLHHLVTFATRAKCLTEGLNKYMCGPTCPLHPTQSEIQNYQIRLQNPGAAKSLCNIFVSVPISLSFFFFDPFFSFGMFAWCTVILNKNPFFENITKIYKLQSFDRSARYIQLHASLLQPKQI